ncbi:MAG TPA: aldose 1-epimerase [Chitinophagaceae bacterium]|nr:aldose 1-epimerase [Chitinophagaceae bacterium]
MPFSVTRSLAKQTTLVHLQHDDIAATIIPSAGAMLHAFNIKTGNSNFNVIDSYPSETAVESTGDWFKGVKLSPWPCRIPAGEYEFQGNKFNVSRLFSDGTALHGLLYDQPFKIVHEFADENSASVIMIHEYLGEDAGYPFKYSCKVQYTLRSMHSAHRSPLSALALEIVTTIKNCSTSAIPIADGWHPYFQLGGIVDDWELEFPATSIVEFNDKLIPTGKLIPYNQFNQKKKIGAIELDNCFVVDPPSDNLVCTLSNPDNGINVQFFAESSYPYLQIFIPSFRKSIAIENLSSAPNAFNNKMGLITLLPGESKIFRVIYKLSLNEKK